MKTQRYCENIHFRGTFAFLGIFEFEYDQITNPPESCTHTFDWVGGFIQWWRRRALDRTPSYLPNDLRGPMHHKRTNQYPFSNLKTHYPLLEESYNMLLPAEIRNRCCCTHCHRSWLRRVGRPAHRDTHFDGKGQAGTLFLRSKKLQPSHSCHPPLLN